MMWLDMLCCDAIRSDFVQWMMLCGHMQCGYALAIWCVMFDTCWCFIFHGGDISGNGQGSRMTLQQLGPGFNVQMQTQCDRLDTNKQHSLHTSQSAFIPVFQCMCLCDTHVVAMWCRCGSRCGMRMWMWMSMSTFMSMFMLMFMFMSMFRCAGKGKIPKAVCPVCGGSKLQKEEKQLEAVIERGMPNAHEVVEHHNVPCLQCTYHIMSCRCNHVTKCNCF